jgi:prepilin-type N-terminal cleavage/methylation domain-containing protein/prepilin-type processing-associated H-X9-DG protein
MTRSMSRAFTLVELMIAIAIVVILVALLIPTFGSAWQVARMTKCQTNLAALYKAQANWNADRDSTDNAMNAGWAGTLTAYLESRTDALICPEAELLAVGGATTTTPGSGGGGTGGASDPPETVYVAPDEPDIQLQDVTIGVLDASKNLLYEIPLAPSPYWSWFQSWTLPDGRTHIGANLDDYFPKDSLGRYTDEDFYFTVEFRGTSPIKVTIGPCDGSANTSVGKWSDFRLNHKPIWNGEVFANLFAAGHVGETIDVQKELGRDPSRNLGYRKRVAYATWTIMSTSKAVLGATSYGLNRGSYQVPYDGPQPALDPANPQPPMMARDVAKGDPKLIFILDYPKAVADYTDIGDELADTAFFDLVFIKSTAPDYEMPPSNWSSPPGLDGRTWQECQALRHFGKANVLFCDGHIEALEKDELDPAPNKHRDMWNYQGR